MYRTSNSQGFTLVEMAIVMIIVGLLAGVAFPMVSMLLKKGESERERAALTEAKEALLGHLLTNGGLPGPNAFIDGSRTHVERDASGIPVAAVAGGPGALPSDRLGIGSRGTGNTLLLYDVHPALRSDLGFSFDPETIDLHDPTNADQGTGGSMLRLCRNLNTLIYVENDPDGIYGNTPDLHRFQYLLPRIWDSTSFSDNDDDHLRERSAPAAFVLVRRAQQSYAWLDRQNGYDNPYNYVTDPLDHRVYENSSTFFNQDIDCEQQGDRTNPNTCYENQVISMSLVELRQHLHDAGHCQEGIARDRNHELRVTVQNSVLASLSLAGGGAGGSGEQYLCVVHAAPGGGPGGGGPGTGTIQSVTIVNDPALCTGTGATTTLIESGSGSAGGGTTPIPLFMEFYENAPPVSYSCNSANENVFLIAPGHSRTLSYPAFLDDGTQNGLSINWFDNEAGECKAIDTVDGNSAEQAEKRLVEDADGWLDSLEHMDVGVKLPELNLHCLGTIAASSTVSCNRI